MPDLLVRVHFDEKDPSKREKEREREGREDFFFSHLPFFFTRCKMSHAFSFARQEQERKKKKTNLMFLLFSLLTLLAVSRSASVPNTSASGKAQGSKKCDFSSFPFKKEGGKRAVC